MNNHWAHNLKIGTIRPLASRYSWADVHVMTKNQLLEIIPDAEKVLNDFATKAILPCLIRNFGKVKFSQVMDVLDPFDEFKIRYDPNGRKFIFDPYTGERIK
jgi:hypothetical protein